VVRHLAGEIDDAAAFEKSVRAASGNEKEMLRAASRRLAPYARGRLADALRQFNFEILYRPEFSLADLDDRFEDDEEGPDFDTDILACLMDQVLSDPDHPPPPPEVLKTLVEPMIQSVEILMDQMRLRGLPREIIHLIRDKIKGEFNGEWIFDHFTALLTPAQTEKLSPEAWEFLFGK
jgi:hypothetical protein